MMPFFSKSLSSSIQNPKKSSHLKERGKQSIVKLITKRMAMNCSHELHEWCAKNTKPDSLCFSVFSVPLW